ncbi:Oxysterol-binding protein [Xylariaceae sp. FL0255]|nr:Oxysterol-binding protein [Xylariaceae sp. FL0255]
MSNSTPPQNPQATGSSWSSFLKSIASFNGDIASLTAPPFILSPTSLTEYSSSWAEHPSVFIAPAKEKDPVKRALLVLKWWLTTCKGHFASRSEAFGNEKKPLNPFLGEFFLAKWEDAVGTTELISEQVSHHPPATAYCIRHEASGVQCAGYNAQKASFSKTINIKQIGHNVLTVPVPDKPGEVEYYVVTLPQFHIEGLIFGSPFVELEGTSHIISSTGYTAKMDYSGKGWLSGKKNSFTATLFPTGKEKEVLYNCSGQWTKAFDIYVGPAKKNSPSTLIETWDPEKTPQTPLTIAPVEEQHPLETRRAWAAVADGVRKVDLDQVHREKTKIEMAQRAMRKKEQSEGRMWQRRFFTIRTEPDPVLESLAPLVGLDPQGDADKTGGLWRFDPVKTEKVKDEKLTAEEKAAMARDYLGQE